MVEYTGEKAAMVLEYPAEMVECLEELSRSAVVGIDGLDASQQPQRACVA